MQRWRVLGGVALGWLVACGGPPVVERPWSAALVWTGGRPAVCLVGDRLRVVQGEAQSRWHLAPDGPVLEATEPAAGPACAESGEGRLADGRRVVWGVSGIFLGAAEGDLAWWRPAAGRLAAAAYDGQTVRAVGPDGLWQWRPGQNPVPQPLPPDLQGLILTRIFRDGPLLWVADAQVGAPLDVAGAVPVAVAPLAKLPPEDPGLQAVVGGVVVEARRGVAGLRIAGRAVPTVGPVTALLPHDDLVFVAAGNDLWAWRPADGPEPVWQLPLGGPAVALFAEPGGQRILVVGNHQGFGVLTRTR